MSTKPVDGAPADTAEDAVETDFTVPADADLRPSPADDDAPEETE